MNKPLDSLTDAEIDALGVEELKARLSPEQLALAEKLVGVLVGLLKTAHEDARLVAALLTAKHRTDLEIWALISYLHGSLKALEKHKDGDDKIFDDDLFTLLSSATHDLVLRNSEKKEPKK